ncbi:MAG: hypothetical protein HZB81_08855 [Deltaproteobacteria bacterium]|nr:hypothetical protein [Deltaproteobacteria bacterium]
MGVGVFVGWNKDGKSGEEEVKKNLMMQKVVSAIEETFMDFPFIKQAVRIDETENTVKYRLVVEEDLFVQVYVNVATDTTGFVLVNKGQRIYGRDAIDGRWHRHRFENPLSHDFSSEGSKKVSLREFLAEVQEILEREKLL